jgi:hypothetical protein
MQTRQSLVLQRRLEQQPVVEQWLQTPHLLALSQSFLYFFVTLET